MFEKLGNGVSRHWRILLTGWLLALLVAWAGNAAIETRRLAVDHGWPGVWTRIVSGETDILTMTPGWQNVVHHGEFAFLPEEVPSRQGEQLFEQAFPDQSLASRAVIVVRRTSRDGLITDEESAADPRKGSDFAFIRTDLVQGLRAIAEKRGGLACPSPETKDRTGEEKAASANAADWEPGSSIICRIRTYEDEEIGELLVSEDEKAALVIVELTTEFLDYRNIPVVGEIQALIDHRLRAEGKIPPGLDLKLSGSATVGRDMLLAAEESSDATELWTVLLVVILLLAIYRAPVLAFIPLLTVFIAVEFSLNLLALLAHAGIVNLFAGIEVYVTVVSYGAGVDYCLFLIARYKEELDDGATVDESVRGSLAKVGAALTASAGTVMCGIGMMSFAEFGKFQQAGQAMPVSLFVVLCAALSFTPSLLRLFSRRAFWPQIRTEQVPAAGGWISSASPLSRLLDRDWFQGVWAKIGDALLRKPAVIWLTSIAVMLPFAVVGVLFFNHLTYGLLSELPKAAPSVQGTEAVQQHFPAGIASPVTVLLRNPQVDFSKTSGISRIEALTERLRAQRAEYDLADIRSVSHPLGGENALSDMGVIRRRVAQSRAVEYYVSQVDAYQNHVTRLDLIFREDPFSRNSIQRFEQFRSDSPSLLSIVAEGDTVQVLRPGTTSRGTVGAIDKKELTARLASDDTSKTVSLGKLVLAGAETRRSYVGATPSIRDLKMVTDRDQIRIDILVIAGVFLILVLLLRRPAISTYLIVSVFFSYLVTLGVTFAVFWALDPSGFAGLDWKVPMFLFTILIAVGEDYNIFLMTRVHEEQKRHGPVRGVTTALLRTGGIISSCGIIMAGTFSSLMHGSLVGLIQLGFALAFGVLLDTFVVRPILVPAYLVLLHSGRFGVLSRYLGAVDSADRNSGPAFDAGRR